MLMCSLCLSSCAITAGTVSSNPTGKNEDIFPKDSSLPAAEDESDEIDLIEKYLFYRDRLHSRFLVVGREQGHSLPADAIDVRHMHFGDSTVFLGWYMGILATEYYLLTEYDIFSGFLNPCQTLERLYFALNALNRLMSAAPHAFETSFSVVAEGSDGFFVRDDVDFTLLDHFPDVEVLESDFRAGDIFDKEESQDQLIHLMLGLSLVDKCIPETTVVNGVNLIEECEDLALRICSWPAATGWTIKNPYRGNKTVKRGAHSSFFCFPIVSSVQKIRGHEDELSDSVRPLYKFIWEKWMKHNLSLGCTTQHLILTLGSISNSWGEETLKHLMNMSYRYNWPIYPMVNILLYADNLSENRQYLGELLKTTDPMLRSAPDSGISHSHSPPGWKASHRFLFDVDTQNDGQDYYAGKDFSGVDFLLLHNIYQILRRW